MSLHSIRAQLLGVALILVGGLWDLQNAVHGSFYSPGTLLVYLGVAAVLAGFVSPFLATGASGDDGPVGVGRWDDPDEGDRSE